MNNGKKFDCVLFKNELQKNLLKNSGAKNIDEYVNYSNKIAMGSSLHKGNYEKQTAHNKR